MKKSQQKKSQQKNQHPEKVQQTNLQQKNQQQKPIVAENISPDSDIKKRKMRAVSVKELLLFLFGLVLAVLAFSNPEKLMDIAKVFLYFLEDLV